MHVEKEDEHRKGNMIKGFQLPIPSTCLCSIPTPTGPLHHSEILKKCQHIGQHFSYKSHHGNCLTQASSFSYTVLDNRGSPQLAAITKKKKALS